MVVLTILHFILRNKGLNLRKHSVHAKCIFDKVYKFKRGD